jgi:hypothetical protein
MALSFPHFLLKMAHLQWRNPNEPKKHKKNAIHVMWWLYSGFPSVFLRTRGQHCLAQQKSKMHATLPQALPTL